MERYSEYKDSGVQWLGQIPGHWKTMRLGLLGDCANGVSKGGDYFGEGYPFVAYSDVYKNMELPHTVEGLAKSTEDDRQRYSIEYGDVFFTRTSETIQEIGFSSTCLKTIPNAVFAGFLIRFRPSSNELVPEFSKYYFRCNNLRSFYITRMNLVTRASLSQSLLRQLTVVLPPISEQKSIANYLDDKCKKIDQMIVGKQKQLELLTEMKQRIISDTVMHGLNPDAPMKATNVPWMPDIPKHWELRRLKTLFSQRLESYNPDERLEVLSLLKDVGVIPYSEKGNVGNKAKEDYSSYRVARKGDIVMNSMNVIIGSVDITQYDGYISPAYYALTAKPGVSTEYYNYIFHMKACQKHMRSLANGILEIRLRISTSNLFGMYYPVPPREEQLAIVDYIDNRMSNVNCLANKLQQEIESIKEYKQRLISDVVTGQIKVC